MTTKAPWSMLNTGELPTKFWVVTITKPDGEGGRRLADVRAYMTHAGAKYFYTYTRNSWAGFYSSYYGRSGYADGYDVTLTEYQADEGTVLNTFTNTKEESNG